MPSPFYRATFLEPVEERDQDGQIVQRLDAAFSDRVDVIFLRGTEKVMEARLASRSPVVIKVRASSNSRRITSEWVVSVDGRTYEIKEDPRPSDNRRWLEMLAEAKR